MMFKKFDKEVGARIMWSLFLVILVMMPEAAYASFNETMKKGICQIVDAMTGDIGSAVATLSVVFLGIGAFFGKVNWGLALMFGAGIVAIFGATSIATGIGGGSGGC